MRPQRLNDHPSRAAILDEIHARPVELLGCPARVRRVALVLPREPDAVTKAIARFADWCRQAGVTAPPDNSRQHSFDAGSRHVTWELHTEFVTLSWSSNLADAENWPEGIGLEAFESEPLIACVRIDLIEGAVIPDRIVSGFRLTSLCASTIEGGTGQVATDFVPDADGFTRFELAAGEFPPLRRAVIVRRLLEIETYRSMALLGLPLARSISPELTAEEADLGTAVAEMGQAETIERAQTSLEKLHALSVRSGQLVEHTSYRFAASHAYGDILRRRLRSLNEVAIHGASTLERYLGNRLDPALATCLAVEKRQTALSEKIERAIELLNTRISLDLQMQNKEVLRTIANTSRSQFRLQRTVEGLSTIAISYYLLGILGYVFTGASEVAHFSKAIAIALAAPVVILLVWLGVRAIRRHAED